MNGICVCSYVNNMLCIYDFTLLDRWSCVCLPFDGQNKINKNFIETGKEELLSVRK